MDRMIPLEQLAEERMKVMVDAQILNAQILIEAGVDPETVIAANEKTWAEIGRRTAEAFGPIYAGKPGLFTTDQLGAMIKEMFGIAVKAESVPEGRRFTITQCPWRKRVQALGIDVPRRYCRAAHNGFLLALTTALSPQLVVEMNDPPTDQETDCCVTIQLFPKTTVGKE